MLAVDTNVLVRLLTYDDDAQVTAAESFISKGAWVSHLVLEKETSAGHFPFGSFDRVCAKLPDVKLPV
jgi:hypothetical protein